MTGVKNWGGRDTTGVTWIPVIVDADGNAQIAHKTSSIMVPTDVQSSYIMVPVDIQAQYITLKVDVVSMTGGAVSTATNTKVSVGSADTQVLVANASRKFAAFVNDSNEVIYLSLSATAVMNEGIRLNANGGSYWINLLELYTGEVSAICSSGSKNLTVMEG